MSRSGYSEDCDGWQLIMWRGAVNSAMKGRRGQKFFLDMKKALDAMTEKKLVAGELVCDDGVCALGALGQYRNIEMGNVNVNDTGRISEMFDIAPALASEIVYVNDECGPVNQTQEQRWERMRCWIE